MFGFFRKKGSKSEAPLTESGAVQAELSPAQRAARSDYRAQFAALPDAAPGWDAIDDALNKIYDGAEPDLHMGTIIRYSLGGEDPLDGMSAYIRQKPDPHIHYVSYGFSELWVNEDAAGQEYSKYGFELTFRLKLDPVVMPLSKDDIPHWPMLLLQYYAKYVFSTGKIFLPGQYLNAQNPLDHDGESGASDITGTIFVIDPELGEIDTLHGKVQFLQLVGATRAEIAALTDKMFTGAQLAEVLSDNNPLLLTDMKRCGAALWGGSVQSLGWQ